MAYGQSGPSPRHHGDNDCEWNEFGEVVCPDPTWTPPPVVPPTATFTSVPTATFTSVPTATFTSVPTATFTSVPTATFTSVPTATFTSVPTATFTSVPPTATPTPTPSPAPTKPSGWIRAAPAKTIVGQFTTISAGWSGGIQPRLVIEDTTILGESPDCGAGGASGGRSVGPRSIVLLPSEPKRLYGCSGGLTAVQLRDAGRNRTLDTVTVEVLPILSITAHEQVAYRWLNVTFTGHSAYTYTVEWRTKAGTEWKALPTAPTHIERSRVKIFGHSADIRGLPYSRNEFAKIVVRIGGRTAEGRASTSTAYGITRVKPRAAGHQPDHEVDYNLSALPATGLGAWLSGVAPDAASAWASASPYLSATAGSRIKIALYDPDVHKSCPEPTACVNYGALPNTVETRLIGSIDMVFYQSPVYEGRTYRWTDNEDLNMKKDPDDGSVTYMWVGGVLTHEFGHTFGLKHPDSDQTGIMHVPNVMEDGLTTITDADKAAVRQIYHGHVKNEGW